MRILEIKGMRGGEVAVTVAEQEEPFILDKETCFIAGLSEHTEIDEESWQNLITESDERRAFRAAVSFLDLRMRTQKEVEDRLLQKGFTELAIESAIEKAKEYRLIDDADYARRFVRDRLERKGVGERAIRYELIRKGIDREMVEQALGTLEQDAQLERARQYIPALRRKYSALQPRESRARAGTFLARKGFDWDTIGRVLSDWGEEDDA